MKKDAGSERSALLPELKKELARSGHITQESMSALAGKAGVQPNEVYGVATFYSYLPVEKAGRNIIRVCSCLPCDLRAASGVIAGISQQLGVAPGQTTPDHKFTFELVNCIGACDQAPAMMINDTVYGNLTPARIAEILKSY